jgi:cytochrome c oxidase subunit II
MIAGCEGRQSALDPQGPGARDIAALWWFIFALIGAITVAVLVLVAVALLRARSAREHGSARLERRFIVGGGIVLPLVTAVVLMVATVVTIESVPELSGRPIEVGEPEIEVIGHRFWWEVRYPGHGITTANEIHVPAGRPIVIGMTSLDVIHSFWVPKLHGKIDLTPGHSTYITLEADRPGEYRGQCAEFCGVQHALMGMLVIAESEDDYEAWLEREAQPARSPQTDEQEAGLQAFFDVGCDACHRLRGTDADGDLGPDLTHFGARRTIGAATVENNRGNLGGWIVDAQSIKPGNLMPPMRVESDQLLNLLDYLESLE